MATDLVVAPATPAHRGQVLELLHTSLGWDATDERFARFFRWKHDENPFGPSLGLVALDGERVVGVRLLLRWEFTRDCAPVRAVRAVDTATHPSARGQGVFTRLTLAALDELHREGVGFVFNTPNDQSRPGYLKMGWSVVGRLPLAARPRSVGGLVRMARARGAGGADRWGAPSALGEAATDVLADEATLARLLDTHAPPPQGIATRRTIPFLRWRYGLDLLGYRALAHPAGLAEGVVLFRVRARGEATEAAICDVLVPGDDAAARRALLRRFAGEVDADYAIALGSRLGRAGFVPLPRQGPVLTWRAVARATMPPRADWHVGLGDVELF